MFFWRATIVVPLSSILMLILSGSLARSSGVMLLLCGISSSLSIACPGPGVSV